MPRVRLALNIGKKDAQRFDLAPEDTLAGKVVNVKQDVAGELLAKGWAVEDRPEATATVQATPGAPKLKAPGLPDLNALTKADLEALAKKHGLKDVHAGLSKDEMIEAIEDGLTR